MSRLTPVRAGIDRGLGRPLRLLMAEDSAMNAELVVAEIRRGGFDVELKRVTTPAEAARELRSGNWELVISDFLLPGWGGDEALALFNEANLDIPFLLISGVVSTEAAVAAHARRGA